MGKEGSAEVQVNVVVQCTTNALRSGTWYFFFFGLPAAAIAACTGGAVVVAVGVVVRSYDSVNLHKYLRRRLPT